jgi:hypothetical protein
MKNNLVRISIFSVALLALGMLFSGISFAAADKLDVCHITGNGTYILVNVSMNALPSHMDHGDALPGDNIAGELLLDDCSLVAVSIVNSSPLNYGPTGWGGWSCPTGTTVLECNVNAGASYAQKILWIPGATAGTNNYPTTPFGYTYTPPETGCIVQNDNDGETITITLTCAIDD